MRLIVNIDSGEITGSPFGLGDIGGDNGNFSQLSAKLYETKTMEVEFRRADTLNGETEDMGTDPGLNFLVKPATGAARFDTPSLLPNVTFTRAGVATAYYYTGTLNFAQPAFQKYLAADHANQFETLTLLCVADVSSSLGGTFFDLYTTNSAFYRVWIDVGNASVAPSTGAGTLLEVDISANASAATVASTIKTALEANGTVAAAYTIGIATDTLTITAKAFGTKGHHTAGTTGFTLTLTVCGMSYLSGTDVDDYEFSGELQWEENSQLQLGPTVSVLLRNALYRPNQPSPISILPGGVLSTLVSLGVTGVSKASATTRTASTTLTADPDLVLALTTGTHRITGSLVWKNESANPGNKAQLTFSGTATAAGGIARYSTDAGTVTGETFPNATDSTILVPVFTATAQDNALAVDFIIVVTVAGNLGVNWAQNTSHADDTTLSIGSHLLAVKIA